MLGRYGHDPLNQMLNVAALVLFVLSLFFRSASSWLYATALALLILTIFRMLSRNEQKRSEENRAYQQILARAKGQLGNWKTRLTQRKTHRFFKCPACKQQVRVPKGLGRINVNCPKCGNKFEKNT